MATSARVLSVMSRACGGAALLLGLAFWMGYARSFTRLHMVFGIALVLAVWSLAAVAWKSTVRRDLAVLAVAIGLIGWVFGITHALILPGPLHWIVQVAHLGVGVLMVALGERLSAAVTGGRLVARPA